MDNTDNAIELSQTTALTNAYFSPVVWKQMKEMATTFIESRALPQNIANAQQAIMIMQSGYEMGLKPIESLKSLYIVNGQINIWGAALMRRLREHGWRIEYKNSIERGGSVTAIARKDKERYEDTASFDAAEKSGYTKSRDGSLKVGWKEGINRQLKLRYLAVSMLIKTYIPEVMGSVSDIQEVAEDYPVVEEVEVKDDPKVIMTATSDERKNTLSNFIKAKTEKKDKKKTPKEKSLLVEEDGIIESMKEDKKTVTESKEAEK